MKNEKLSPDGRVVSFIDIGTNSVRLLVVRLNPNHSYSILTQQKQQVRLGDGEFVAPVGVSRGAAQPEHEVVVGVQDVEHERRRILVGDDRSELHVDLGRALV